MARRKHRRSRRRESWEHSANASKGVAALRNHVIVKPNGMAAVDLESLPTVVDLAVRMRAVTVRSLGFESCALPPTAPFHPLTRAALLPPQARMKAVNAGTLSFGAVALKGGAVLGEITTQSQLQAELDAGAEPFIVVGSCNLIASPGSLRSSSFMCLVARDGKWVSASETGTFVESSFIANLLQRKAHAVIFKLNYNITSICAFAQNDRRGGELKAAVALPALGLP